MTSLGFINTEVSSKQNPGAKRTNGDTVTPQKQDSYRMWGLSTCCFLCFIAMCTFAGLFGWAYSNREDVCTNKLWRTTNATACHVLTDDGIMATTSDCTSCPNSCDQLHCEAHQKQMGKRRLWESGWSESYVCWAQHPNQSPTSCYKMDTSYTFCTPDTSDTSSGRYQGHSFNYAYGIQDCYKNNATCAEGDSEGWISCTPPSPSSPISSSLT